MSIKSYSTLELSLKDELAATKEQLTTSENLLIQLHQIICQASDVTGSELEQTNIIVKELNDVVCSCYTLLTDYLVEEEVL